MDEIKERDSKGCRENKFIAALLTVAWGIRHANKTGWDDMNDICYYYDKAKDHLDEKDRKKEKEDLYGCKQDDEAEIQKTIWQWQNRIIPTVDFERKMGELGLTGAEIMDIENNLR